MQAKRNTGKNYVTVTFYKTSMYIVKIEQCLTVNIQSCGFALSSTRADQPKVCLFFNYNT